LENIKILYGGSMNEVIKAGNTVHRRAQGHPMLHRYLLFLEESGMLGVPRFLGFDEQGREILSFIPGKTMGVDYPPDHPCLHSDETLQGMAKILRQLHDISVEFVPIALENGWINPYFPDEIPETICHNDTNIWNFAFVDERPVGLFDFDQAYPGARVWDLASTVFSAVGLVPYDYIPAEHAVERKRLISLLFEAYGMDCPINFLDILIRRHQIVCDETVAELEAGFESAVKAVESGALAHYQRVVKHMKEHGSEWF